MPSANYNNRHVTAADQLPKRGHLVRLKSKSPNKEGVLMLFPEKKNDNRCLVIGTVNGGHREAIRIDEVETTATIIERSAGYGAFGSGECFIAVLKNSEQVVSCTKRGGYREVYASINGYVVHYNLTEEEYALMFGNGDIEKEY